MDARRNLLPPCRARRDSNSPALPTLTGKQATHIAAHIAGKSAAAIAKSEGVSRQAVARSIARETVREHIAQFAATYGIAGTGDDETKPAESIANALVKQLVEIALGAKKPVVLSFTMGDTSHQEIKYAPDYRIRLEAATRLLEIFVDAQRPNDSKLAESAPNSAEAVEIFQEVETMHTRSRKVRRSGS